MKKTLTLLTLLLAITIMASAQSTKRPTQAKKSTTTQRATPQKSNAQSLKSKLIGTWEAYLGDVNESKDVYLTLTLRRDGTSKTSMRMNLLFEEDGYKYDINFSLSVNGGWTLDGDKLTINNDVSNISCKVNHWKVNGESWDHLKSVMEEVMAKNINEELSNNLESLSLKNINFIGSNSFTVIDGGETVTFRRTTAK